MGKDKPRICAAIVSDDIEPIKRVESLVDLFEVRIDLIGDGWRELAKELKKPWIACNRRMDEGGRWQESESNRIEELLSALELGANIVDIELETEGLEKVTKLIKKRAECLISHHDLKGTPSSEKMRQIIQKQIAAGADICKLVTTARRFTDNLAVLQLILDFPATRIVSFAMEVLGLTSRLLCPLVGGDFVYASIEEGKESASGQITVSDLRKIYRTLGYE